MYIGVLMRRGGRGWISSQHGRNEPGKTRLKVLSVPNKTMYVSELVILRIIDNLLLSCSHFPAAIYTQSKVPQRAGEEVLGFN